MPLGETTTYERSLTRPEIEVGWVGHDAKSRRCVQISCGTPPPEWGVGGSLMSAQLGDLSVTCPFALT